MQSTFESIHLLFNSGFESPMNNKLNKFFLVGISDLNRSSIGFGVVLLHKPDKRTPRCYFLIKIDRMHFIKKNIFLSRVVCVLGHSFLHQLSSHLASHLFVCLLLRVPQGRVPDFHRIPRSCQVWARIHQGVL
jgi:hypothetical protein